MVYSNTVSTSSLTAFLNVLSVNDVISPIEIPAHYFHKDTNYTIISSTCNFLGLCRSGNITISVSSSSFSIPMVTVLGSSARILKRHDFVKIVTMMPLSTTWNTSICGSGSVSGSTTAEENPFVYTWSVVNSTGHVVSNITNASPDPSQFILEPFVLSVQQYQIIGRVHSNSFAAPAIVSVDITIIPGDVVARIKGMK